MLNPEEYVYSWELSIDTPKDYTKMVDLEEVRI